MGEEQQQGHQGGAGPGGPGSPVVCVFILTSNTSSMFFILNSYFSKRKKNLIFLMMI